MAGFSVFDKKYAEKHWNSKGEACYRKSKGKNRETSVWKQTISATDWETGRQGKVLNSSNWFPCLVRARNPQSTNNWFLSG